MTRLFVWMPLMTTKKKFIIFLIFFIGWGFWGNQAVLIDLFFVPITGKLTAVFLQITKKP